ncbi:MAG TPA: VCBS repeat-containing protein [Candidatus Limnocylindria bacterium]|nr:VCBS repeat-containing protein [Candidatus Limnocylindria bacterium]
MSFFRLASLTGVAAVAGAMFVGCAYHPERTGILVARHSSASLSPSYVIHSFQRQQLNNEFWSEGACFADINHDGRMDVVAGPYWYEGPSFAARHAFMAADHVSKSKKNGKDVTFAGFKGGLGSENEYSHNFFAYTSDFNHDGWADILILGFPGEESWWFENPGKDAAQNTQWKRHVAIDVTDDESPQWVDITGDGKPEIVCASKGSFGYAEPDPSAPDKPFTWHAISPNLNLHKFTHGLGIGDVNGDGRPDLLEKDGWWEQPTTAAGSTLWKQHKWPFGTGGAQMYAYDVNGDGLNDVITSISAHGYGLAWYEQYREMGEIKFKEHIFMNKEAKENRYGVHFSQLHAIDLVDMDGDGIKDIVTGKRFWAHGPEGDPEPNATPYLYWFQIKRGADKSVDFVPHLIDDASGTGTQVMAQDYNGDGLPDVVVGNKAGVSVFTHKVMPVSRTEWEAAQPKPWQ